MACLERVNIGEKSQKAVPFQSAYRTGLSHMNILFLYTLCLQRAYYWDSFLQNASGAALWKDDEIPKKQ